MLAADIKAFPTSGNAFSFPEEPIIWKQIVDPVQPFLEGVTLRMLEQVKEFDSEIAPYAHYALNAQGKQLRSTLVVLSARCVGPVHDSHTTFATIIEMIHLATLVHDDVMDEAEMRRGRPTVSSNWGNTIAILVGDCLFALALKLAASFTTPDVCRAVAQATNKVCSGEILQTQRRRNFQISRQEYLKILEMKTAELFALACDLGASLTPTPAETRQSLGQFGLLWGTAYQLYDDCVDLFGSESKAGKSLGTDLNKGKLTLPLLVCFEKATAEERMNLEQWIQDWNEAHFPKLRELMDKYSALEESVTWIERYILAAKEQLAFLPESEGQKGLDALANYLWQQSRGLILNR